MTGKSTSHSPKSHDANDVDPRIVAAENLLVYHPSFKRCLTRLGSCLSRTRFATEPYCLAVLGDSGIGKTTIIQKFESLNPRKELKDRTEIPVLVASVPSKPTVAGLAETLLYELGDPAYSCGTATNKTKRLIELMRWSGVRMTLLDEFQHFVDKANKNVPHEVADWLKSFIDKSKSAVGVFGLERCTEVFKLNDQLQRRFSAQIRLTPFGWRTTNERSLFRGFLQAVQAQLSIPMSITLADPDIAFRFWYASTGRTGYVMKIIRPAVHELVENRATRLSLSQFASAFETEVWSETDCTENPFLQSFKIDPDSFLNKTDRSQAGASRKRGDKSTPSASEVLRA